jgi:hypothetical protein
MTDSSSGSKIRATPDCFDNGLSVNIYGEFSCTVLELVCGLPCACLVLQRPCLSISHTILDTYSYHHTSLSKDLPLCLRPFAGTVYFLTDCDAFTRAWYKDNKKREVSPAVGVPGDPLDMFRMSRRRCKATLGPPSPRNDDMARFNEARLGKPSNVLTKDSLRQFLVCSFNSPDVSHLGCSHHAHVGCVFHLRPHRTALLSSLSY